MSNGQFRCCIYANDYEQTLGFYSGSLGFLVSESWDRGPDDKGTLFGVASGFVEVLARPKAVEATFDWGEAAPSGVMVFTPAPEILTVIKFRNVTCFRVKFHPLRVAVSQYIYNCHKLFRFIEVFVISKWHLQ